MKQLLFVTLAAILTLAFIPPLVRAQTNPVDSLDIQSTQAVAFVKTDRSIIYIKRPGQPVDAYDFAAVEPGFIDSIRNIAVIGMTPQGDRIMIGASLFFFNNSDGTHDLFRGIMSFPWPFNDSSFHQRPIDTMQRVSMNASFRPAGVMSADGTQWWAVTSSACDGNVPLIFYHGRTDGSGTIDSAIVTASVAGGGAALQDGYQLSNIEIDKNQEMFATSFDGLNADQRQSGRALFYRWPSGSGQNGLSASNFTGSMKTLNDRIFDQFDSVFGVTVQAKSDGTTFVGMTPGSDNSIDLYSVPVNNPSISLSFTPDHTIDRSLIPTGEDFFAGRDCGPYKEDIEGAENGQAANSGDVNFSVTGDTVVFVTHESPYNCNNRNARSGVWMYDMNAAPQYATLVYDDSSAQELQPVFVTAKDTIPHPPGISQDVTTKDFGTVDTAKSVSETITITDTSIFAGTIIDSAKITGTNASDFTVTSPAFPLTLNRRASVPISITFAPTMTKGPRSATLTVYSSMSTNQSISVSLTGTAQVLSGGGVAQDPALAANIEIDPNPFNSQTSVRLTAQDAGTLGIVVHDALGRIVYTSDIRRVGAGATETFAFDANSLGLASGVYVVTGLFGDRSASREVVLTK